MLKKINIGLILMIGLLTSVWGIVTAAPINTVSAFPPGDCNGNGSVTAADIVTIRTAIETNDGLADGDCDANSDGVVDAGDLACVSLLVAGGTCDAPDSRTLIGTNLDQAVHYTSQYAFADPLKQSSGWFPVDHSYTQLPVNTVLNPPLDLDDNGWPRSLPDCSDGPDPSANYCYLKTVLYGFGGDFPAGQYLVTQEGKGRLGFDGQGVSVDWDTSCIGCDPGYYTLNVDDSNALTSISVNVTLTGDPNDATNYLRNIKVYPPGYAPDHLSPNSTALEGANFGNLFHDDFVDSLSQYGVIRFMDWMRTNWENGEQTRSAKNKVEQSEWVNMETSEEADARKVSGSLPRNDMANFNQLTDWADRPLMDDAFYSLPQGVPAEAMIDLVNIVDSSPWFNMPHQASDDYITGFATLAHDTLTTDKPIYIEYSNEIWNDRFSQGLWIELMGLTEFPVQPGVTESQQHAGYKWYGKRTNEICEIWRQVFVNDPDRIVCVVGGQANIAGINGTGSYEWVMDAFLGCDFQLNCTNTEIDAFAIAPYFGQDVGHPDYESTVENWTTAMLFGHIMIEGVLGTDTRSALGQAQDNTRLYVDAAAERGMKLISYEGGQHLVGINETNNNQDITDLFIGANRDPMMGIAYDNYLNNWRAAGGDLFVHFTHMNRYTQSGSWGTREFYDQSSPKSFALDRYATESYDSPRGELKFDTPVSSGAAANPIWDVPIVLESTPNNVQAVSFVLAYDVSQFTVDNVTLEQNQGDHTLTVFDDNNDGLLSITVASDSATETLTDGTLIRLELTEIASSGTGVAFTAGTQDAGQFDLPKPMTCGSVQGTAMDCIVSAVPVLATMTPTPVTTPTPVITPTSTPIATATDVSVTITAPTTTTVTPTSTSSATVQPIVTVTPTATVTVTPTVTPTATMMPTHTPTSTITVMPVATDTPIPSPTNTPTMTPTATSTPVPTATNTPEPPLNTAVSSIGAGKLQYLPWVTTAGTALVVGTVAVQRSRVR